MAGGEDRGKEREKIPLEKNDWKVTQINVRYQVIYPWSSENTKQDKHHQQNYT